MVIILKDDCDKRTYTDTCVTDIVPLECVTASSTVTIIEILIS